MTLIDGFVQNQICHPSSQSSGEQLTVNQYTSLPEFCIPKVAGSEEHSETDEDT